MAHTLEYTRTYAHTTHAHTRTRTNEKIKKFGRTHPMCCAHRDGVSLGNKTPTVEPQGRLFSWMGEQEGLEAARDFLTGRKEERGKNPARFGTESASVREER